MNALTWTRRLAAGALLTAGALGASAWAYTAPESTPAGLTLVDVSSGTGTANPMFLWRRLGDANGNPLYTYDADQGGKSSCFAECAQEFPPLLADSRAKAAGDFSILTRDDHTRQWVYQGKPLYRYSGKDPQGEPGGKGRLDADSGRASFDPASRFFSPKQGWRRAAFTPEKTTAMPPTVELDGLAIASGFGFVDAATHMTVYAAPATHKLSSDWHPVRASALAVPVGEFTIINRTDDGTRQWAYRGEALYTYAGDYAPGEVTGIFAGDKSIQTALAYRNFTPAGVEIGHYVARGPLMTTSKGLALYYVARFYALYSGRETRTGYAITYNDAKSEGTAGCEGDCAKSWKPLLAPANSEASAFWEIVTRPDGTKQWAFKGSPVYTFIGDKKPGDISGNNRDVILYGGSHGEFTYADPGIGGDTRDAQPLLGNVDMRFAVASPEDAAADAPTAGAAKGSRGRTAGDKPYIAPALSASAAGAGLYWHLVSLFY